MVPLREQYLLQSKAIHSKRMFRGDIDTNMCTDQPVIHKALVPRVLDNINWPKQSFPATYPDLSGLQTLTRTMI